LNTTVLMVVASPLYKQHYDLQAGACLEEDAEQVEVYSVRLEGERPDRPLTMQAWI
jgi:nitrite reductase/ring-hydroxylating ferredoxin subunit